MAVIGSLTFDKIRPFLPEELGEKLAVIMPFLAAGVRERIALKFLMSQFSVGKHGSNENNRKNTVNSDKNVCA